MYIIYILFMCIFVFYMILLINLLTNNTINTYVKISVCFLSYLLSVGCAVQIPLTMMIYWAELSTSCRAFRLDCSCFDSVRRRVSFVRSVDHERVVVVGGFLFESLSTLLLSVSSPCQWLAICLVSSPRWMIMGAFLPTEIYCITLDFSYSVRTSSCLHCS